MISILIPTRKRTWLLKQTIESIISKASTPDNVDIKLYIDDDDQESIEFTKNLDSYWNTTAIVGPRIIFSDTYNQLYKQLPCHDIIMFTGDDMLVHDQNWDLEVISTFNRFKDKILFAYPNNGLIKHDFGSEGFLHKNWINTLGEIFPPIYHGEYCDSHINFIADRIGGRKIKLNTFMEHFHYSNQRRESDQTDAEKFERQRNANSQRVFFENEGDRNRKAEKLIDFIRDFKNSNNKVAE